MECRDGRGKQGTRTRGGAVNGIDGRPKKMVSGSYIFSTFLGLQQFLTWDLRGWWIRGWWIDG